MANSKNPRSRTIQVDLGRRTYPIHIGRDLLADFSNLIEQKFSQASHAVIFFDEHVKPIANRARSDLEKTSWRITAIEIPSGESSKSVSQAEQLWNSMLAAHTDRGSIAIAIGGGVVGDLAGFMAASFARGIPLVQVPTTLLSQVDSSVGGKTGINLPGAKNIIGAFWQPSLVVIDSATLNSLPQREYVSGLAEVAKYGVIMLPDLLDYLEENYQAILAKDSEAVAHMVAESCQAKALVVQEDERETSGRRAILNYGHTFAHAMESVCGYGTFLHGEAVSMGMHMAAILARRLGRVDDRFVQRQETLLNHLELPTRFPDSDALALWQAMQHDKKVEHGKLRFVLPSAFGQVELVPGIVEHDVVAAIEEAS